MRFLLLFGLLLALPACSSLVPADAPIQLNATAGAPISINDEVVNAATFIVDYPDGWRVVKLSLAGDPIELAFVSPEDEQIWIKLSESGFIRPETTIDPNYYERFERVDGLSGSVHLWGQSLVTQREEFDVIFDAVVASIRFP